jgi:hypothetical protein
MLGTGYTSLCTISLDSLPESPVKSVRFRTAFWQADCGNPSGLKVRFGGGVNGKQAMRALLAREQ